MAGAYLIDTHALLFANLSQCCIGVGNGDQDKRRQARRSEHFFRLIYESGYLKLSIEIEHLDRYRELPLHHRDPFDRLLIAQAQVEGLSIISNDDASARYGVNALW